MSVIVKNKHDGNIRVMCKGADSIVIPLLKKGQEAKIKKTQEFLDDFSKEGLRTLVIAEKIISEADYTIWNRDYQKALVETQNREEKVSAVAE
jgi:magnesium-transporting ATPase (P-type)